MLLAGDASDCIACEFDIRKTLVDLQVSSNV